MQQLGVVLVAAALGFFAAGTVSKAQTTTLAAGPDPFRTVSGTAFDFSGFPIPADFFDAGSKPFASKVELRGAPLNRYSDKQGHAHNAAGVDTVVERLTPAKLPAGFPSRASVDIELTALSLRSPRPIVVDVNGHPQRWEVAVEPSPSRRSEGKMTITRNNARGGTFESELYVYPQFTFVRQGDGVRKTLDVGQLAAERKLPPESRVLTPLRAQKVPWTERPAPGALPGWSNDFFAVSCGQLPAAERSALATHNVCRP